MNILITGGSGYLGGLLVQALCSKNKIGLLLREASVLPDRLQSMEGLSIGRYTVETDIHEFILKFRPDVVIHAACSYGRLNEMSDQIIEGNITFGSSILKSIGALNKAVSFVNIGTSLPPSVSFYAFTKNEFINFARWFCNEANGQIQFINLIVEHFYGPHESGQKFIPYLIEKCIANCSEIELTMGDQQRDFIYVDDLVEAISVVISKLPSFDIFDSIQIGSGMALSIKQAAKLIHELTDSVSVLKFGAIPYRKDEIMLSKADLRKINRLGWSPRTSFDIGIRSTIKMNLLAKSNEPYIK